jgi:hypothetical protein
MQKELIVRGGVSGNASAKLAGFASSGMPPDPQTVTDFLIEAVGANSASAYTLSPVWDFVTKSYDVTDIDLKKAHIFEKLAKVGYLMEGESAAGI